MRGIISFFLRNTVAANLLMVFILLMGMFGFLGLKTTFFPEQESRLISIQLIYPGASPEEMEEGVVTKIEENLIGISNVKETSSVSSENAATVTVEVERGANTDIVLQDVKNAVDQINSFPQDLEPPIIYKLEQFIPSYVFSLSGDMDLKTLKTYARQVEDDLLAINGISQITIAGFPEEEIEISFRESAMRALNITFDEAVSAVRQNNLLTTGGTIKTATEELLIRAKNKEYYADDLADIVVRNNPNGGVIRLHQIANIKDKWVDSPNRSFIDQEPGVVISVFNTTEEDMFENSDNTIAYLEEFKKKYPHVKVKEVNDGKESLEDRIEFIKVNGLIGFLIVLVLLALFLNIRLGFWVALAIPISFAGMFIAAALIGVTINVITTFAMIIVIGILVDDGIVIAENIYQHHERGAPPMQAALEGTMEVLPAVSSAILTTVIAFSSFFYLGGGLGDIFPEMAIVVIFSLIFSLVEGAFILPAHVAHSKALKEGGDDNWLTRQSDKVMNFLKSKVYSPLLKTSMKFAFPIFAICIGGLIMTVGAINGGIIGTTFFPNIQEDFFAVDVEMPAGTREDQVAQVLDRIEKVAMEVNDDLSNEFFGGEKSIIEVTLKSIGPTTYEGSLVFYLLKGDQREEVRNRMIVSNIKERLGTLTGVDKLVFNLGNIFGDPVSISLLGSNADQLEMAVEEFKSELRKISELTDIQDSNREGLKEIVLELTPKAKNLGFTLGEVMSYVRQGFFGAEIQRLQRGSDEVRVWVRYDLKDRSSIRDLADMRIRSANSQAVPLSDLVNFSTERGLIAINHINGQREIRVTADLATDDASTGDINSDIQNIILPQVLSKYPSVKVGIEGQAKDTAETMESLPTVMGITFLFMLFTIILTFSSVSQALVVFMLIPFSLIGVGLGHWLMGVQMSLFSFLGMVALIGIFVNDALVFISTFNDRIKSGMPFSDALYETGLSRFRPILLTTLTTVAGLLPILLEKSVQAQFLIPLAISIAFGLIVGTFILLALIPSLLVISNRIKLTTTQLWTGETMTAEMVEPAYPGRSHPWLLTLLAALLTLGAIILLVITTMNISQLFA